MGSFMLPIGSNLRECHPEEVDGGTTSTSTNSKRSPSGVIAYNHRLHWSEDERKVRCRLSKVWQKQGVGEDDGETHRHIAIALKVRTTKCVLCCRLCFDPDGLVYIREECHIAKRNSKVQVADKKDLGRRGHSATHKCLVCAVHLCHVKGRFPGCSLTCFELWHTVQHFSNDERTKTLCHVKCPAEGRMDVVA